LFPDHHRDIYKVQDRQLVSGEEIDVHEGDVIVLGKATRDACIVVTWQPTVICVSGSISIEEKENMKVILRRAGGHLLEDWKPETTHLLVEHTQPVKGRSGSPHVDVQGLLKSP